MTLSTYSSPVDGFPDEAHPSDALVLGARVDLVHVGCARADQIHGFFFVGHFSYDQASEGDDRRLVILRTVPSQSHLLHNCYTLH